LAVRAVTFVFSTFSWRGLRCSSRPHRFTPPAMPEPLNSRDTGAKVSARRRSAPRTSSSCSLRRRNRALVGVDDLAAGGEPDALVLLHLGKRALEILDAQRLPDDHGMERKSHDARQLRAVGVEGLELVQHRP